MALIVSDSSVREQITITGSKFLDGWVAKEIIFTSRERAYNDFRGYWMEYFCSLAHYFNFWKSHSWREIQGRVVQRTVKLTQG